MPLAQDPVKRKALDLAREDARLRELATQTAAQEERERQWRVARGTATAEDLKGPIQVGPAQRDTWMTDIPEVRKASAVPTQVNVVGLPAPACDRPVIMRLPGQHQSKLRKVCAICVFCSLRGCNFSVHSSQESNNQFPVMLDKPCYWAQTTFSQRGIQERGDTRGWTETPQQKLLRLSAGEQQRTQALEAAQPQSSAAAEAVDAYNESHRAKTLVEKHQDNLKVSLHCNPDHLLHLSRCSHICPVRSKVMCFVAKR